MQICETAAEIKCGQGRDTNESNVFHKLRSFCLKNKEIVDITVNCPNFLLPGLRNNIKLVSAVGCQGN